jgi:hypothetical protein
MKTLARLDGSARHEIAEILNTRKKPSGSRNEPQAFL